MKIAVIGYGKMGKMVEQAAIVQGHTISAIVDPLLKESSVPIGVPLYSDITSAGNLDGAEAAIEFTQPATALANIRALAEMKIPSVIGTTGWHDKLDDARLAVERAGAALIWAANFSIGVNIFYRIAWNAAQLVNSFPEYDVGGYESHHNKKLDSPSGTARILIDGVLDRIDRKDTAMWETLNRRPLPNEIHFPSLRLGSVPGTHSLFFDSPADTIEITHTARSREGFAVGSVRAAQWLVFAEEKRTGFFTMDDMLNDLFKDMV